MSEFRRNGLVAHHYIEDIPKDKFVRTPRPTTGQIMDYYVKRQGETLDGLDSYTRELFIRCCCSFSAVYNQQSLQYRLPKQSLAAKLAQAA